MSSSLDHQSADWDTDNVWPKISWGKSPKLTQCSHWNTAAGALSQMTIWQWTRIICDGGRKRQNLSSMFIHTERGYSRNTSKTGLEISNSLQRTKNTPTFKTCVSYRLEYSHYYQLGPAHPACSSWVYHERKALTSLQLGHFSVLFIACNFEGRDSVFPQTNSRSAYSLLQQCGPSQVQYKCSSYNPLCVQAPTVGSLHRTVMWNPQWCEIQECCTVLHTDTEKNHFYYWGLSYRIQVLK